MGGRSKRSRAEIVLDILEALTRGPQPPTRLATAANLPYDRLAAILGDLERAGVVRVESLEGRTRVVSLTRKGLTLYSELSRLRRLIRDLGLDIL